MGTRYRYTPEQLLALSESPLSKTKPPGLPAVEEWMGSPQETTRKPGGMKHHDQSGLPDHPNRKPAVERHISRGSANPEDIVLGPPKTSFASATLRNSHKGFDPPDRLPLPREADSRDRFNLRKDSERESDRTREGRNTLRPKRVDGDQDSDGWSTVKPRKSFGAEGAERFNGRMGGDRHRDKDDRRFRDRDDRDVKERPARGFENFSRNNDGERDQDQEGTRRNGMGRGRNEPSWFKDNNETLAPGDRKSNGDRFSDRNRGWREKDRDDRGGDRDVDRGSDRRDRRWERDNEKRQERDPEWMNEPAEEKPVARTQEDFEKWKQETKRMESGTPATETPKDLSGQNTFFGLEKPKVETPLPIETGPDKFFGKYANKDVESDNTVNSQKEGAAKSNAVGKSSRFTSFFSQEDTQRRQTDPLPLLQAQPPPQDSSQVDKEKERVDFQRILMKLSLNGPSPPPQANLISQPPPPRQEKQASAPPHESSQQYRPERQEDPRASARDSQPSLQDLLGQRQSAGSQQSARSEQILQELVSQRQNVLSQGSGRQDQEPNKNAAFLMSLMQNARAAPEPLRSEQVMMGMGLQQAGGRLPQMNDRDQEAQRDRRQRRHDPPPGFYDESFQLRGPQPSHENSRPQVPPQPTQILQRPPPGLDQAPPGWGAPNVQLPPPMSQQRHIGPPPGLTAGPPRAMPMPQSMFPPGFPMGGFGPPPDGMSGPPRGIPPPGFMMPPPGFMGGPPMNTFQGPDGMAFGGPFDGRGAPPPGYRRQ